MIAEPSIWSALPLPAFVIDGGDEVVAANGPAESLLNRSARSLAGWNVTSILHVEGGLGAAISRARRDGGPLTIRSAALRVGHAPPLRCDVHLGPMGGTGMMILLAPQDLPDRLDRARSSRGAARSAIGMAEMLAHEIKNPLAGIAGAAQLLDMSLAGEDAELTRLIVAETRRVVKLLDQVEQFGNLRSPDRRPVNLHDVLERARRSAALGFAADATFVESYDPSLPEALVDPDQLLQVVLNLLKNAAEAAGGAVRIEVRTQYDASLRMRRADGSPVAVPLHVEIIDDGPGVPDDLLPNVFAPFVSGRENGTGLGLALVAKIVAENDGLIGLESRPGRTVFRISLPQADGDRPAVNREGG